MSNFLTDETGFRCLAAMLTDVLRDIAPLEEPNFNELRDAMLNRVSAMPATHTSRPLMKTRGLPEVVGVGVLSLHLLSGTLALIELYRARKIRREERDFEYAIQGAWTKALIQAGMNQELAKTVPVKHCPDMIRFITTQLMARQSDTQEP